MQKVLSTKLEVEVIKRFDERAQIEGESRSGLLKNLVLDYLEGSKADAPKVSVASVSTSSPLAGLADHVERSVTVKSVSTTANGLTPSNISGYLVNSVPSPPNRDSSHDNIQFPIKATISPQHSSNIGWYILGGFAVLVLIKSTTATTPSVVPGGRKPIFGFYH